MHVWHNFKVEAVSIADFTSADELPGLPHLKNKMHKSAEIWERMVDHEKCHARPCYAFHFSFGVANPHTSTARLV